MLSETQQQIQTLINKVDLLDHIARSVASLTIETEKEKSETQVKLAVTHKLKLTDELLRLLGSKE